MDMGLDNRISRLLDRKQTHSSRALGNSVLKKQHRFQITEYVTSLLSPVLQSNTRTDSQRN